MRPGTALTLATATMLALTSCSSSDPEENGSAVVGSEGTQQPDPAPDDEDFQTGDEAEEPADATRGTAADVGGPYGELRDGIWAVGPAGEVEFAVAGPNRLELVEVRPTQGWEITDRSVEPDEIEIDFARGPVEIEIEIEIEGGVLEVEIDQDIDPAEPGRFDVGEAGTVNVSVEDGRIELGAVDLADGWTEVSRESDGEEIELDFRRDGDGFVETWEFDAELDGGRLEVEIDYEIEGSFAR